MSDNNDSKDKSIGITRSRKKSDDPEIRRTRLKQKRSAAALGGVLVIIPAIFLFLGYQLGVAHYEANMGVVIPGKPIRSGWLSSYYGNKDQSQLDQSQFESRYQTYEHQVESLENLQMSLNNLRLFIAKQRTQLKNEQGALEHILKQKETFKPILEAEQATIDAIFKIQADEYERRKWMERFFSFFLGIVATVIGYYLIKLIEKTLFRTAE